MDFKDLNENLDEYNLIKECMNKLGSKIENQYDKYIEKYKNLENRELYENEKMSIEFINHYFNKLNEIYLLFYQYTKINEEEYKNLKNYIYIEELDEYDVYEEIEYIYNNNDNFIKNIICNDIKLQFINNIAEITDYTKMICYKSEYIYMIFTRL